VGGAEYLDGYANNEEEEPTKPQLSGTRQDHRIGGFSDQPRSGEWNIV